MNDHDTDIDTIGTCTRCGAVCDGGDDAHRQGKLVCGDCDRLLEARKTYARAACFAHMDVDDYIRIKSRKDLPR